MEENRVFQLVGADYKDTVVKTERKRKWWAGKPVFSLLILGIIIIACVGCDFFMTHDPTYMNLTSYNQAPNREFWFGTDTMGRDIFSMILYGGRISLFIGIIATALSTFIAVVYGSISGIAPGWLDECMMRFTEILLSIPSILIIIFVQALMGEDNVLVISFVIGITSWMSIAKIVRTEVRQIRESEYVIASRCMGAGFWHLLRVHLLPNFVSSIMFMVVMNVRGAIVAESTLSFLGIGLPIEVISWGSMLSLAEKALMTNSWWMILIPGIFLVITLMCITNIGNYIRQNVNQKQSNL
jgi:peptide/nickel transport system permease protein